MSMIDDLEKYYDSLLEEMKKSTPTIKPSTDPAYKLPEPKRFELDGVPTLEPEEKSDLFCKCKKPKSEPNSADGTTFYVCVKSKGGCGKEIK